MIRPDQYEITRTILAHGSTEDVVALKDFHDNDIFVRRYEMFAVTIEKNY